MKREVELDSEASGQQRLGGAAVHQLECARPWAEQGLKDVRRCHSPICARAQRSRLGRGELTCLLARQRDPLERLQTHLEMRWDRFLGSATWTGIKGIKRWARRASRRRASRRERLLFYMECGNHTVTCTSKEIKSNN